MSEKRMRFWLVVNLVLLAIGLVILLIVSPLLK